MKRLLIAPLLLLASCAPVYGPVQGDKATLRVTDKEVLFSNPGPDAARLPTLLLRGSLSVTDPRCAKMDDQTIGCKLGTQLAGEVTSVFYTGRVTSASVTFYRSASGDRPIYLRWP